MIIIYDNNSIHHTIFASEVYDERQYLSIQICVEVESRYPEINQTNFTRTTPALGHASTTARGQTLYSGQLF